MKKIEKSFRVQAVTKAPGHHFFGYYDKFPWDGFRVSRRFRGAIYKINVINQRSDSAPKITLNGSLLNGTLLPVVPTGEIAEVKVII